MMSTCFARAASVAAFALTDGIWATGITDPNPLSSVASYSKFSWYKTSDKTFR